MAFSSRDFSDIKELGSGRRGNVYLATQMALGRKVVIKQIPATMVQDPKSVESLENELKSAAQLDHDNIIKIFGFSQDKNSFFIMREYIDGPDLEQVMHWQPFPREIGLMILIQAMKGLRHAHEHGIVHGNVTPGNILISKTGKVKIVDFGLARAIARADEFNDPSSALKSPKYRAPEVVSGSPARGIFTDIWPTGVLAYRILCGTEPFAGEDIRKLFYSIVHEREINIRTIVPTLPDDLASELSACLKKDPRSRPPSLDMMIACLKNYLDDLGVRDIDTMIANYISDRLSVGQALAELRFRYHEKKGKEYCDAGNKIISAAHFKEAEKFSVPDKDSNDSKVSNTPRGRIYGLYPKRIEPKPAYTGVGKRKFLPLGIIARLKDAKRIISVAGIIGIVSLSAASVFLIAEKKHTAESVANPEPTQGAQGDSVKQRLLRRLSAVSGVEKEPVPGNATVNQEMTSPDTYEKKTETPALPRKTGSPPAHGKRVRPGLHSVAVSAGGRGAQSAQNILVVDPNARKAASNSPKPVKTGTGLLHVYTYPWANLSIDNIFEGTTPTSHPISLAVGEHSLMVQRDGYKSYSGTVHVDEGDTTRIKIQLEQ